MGTLVTLHLPPSSPVAAGPWVITIGALDPTVEDWEPVVCGPYERAHALALARAVVRDDDLVAVVEPMLALDAVEAIRQEVDLARSVAEQPPVAPDEGATVAAPGEPPAPAEVRAGWQRLAAAILAP